MTLAPLLFWLPLAIVAYTWIGYALVVDAVAAFATRARHRRRRGARDRRVQAVNGSRPRISVVVAAYNEAPVIAAKIASALTQRYPADRIEVIVVSDGSTDGTDGIVAAMRDRRVRLLRQEPRAGKSAALNRGVAAARGSILVFTDANALFARETLARLAAPFADPRVGLVSGQGLYGKSDGESDAGAGVAPAREPAPSNNVAPAREPAPSNYVRYEAFLKAREAARGFVAGADGAVYALRRSIYRDLGPAEINDLLHPIQAALMGYTCRFEPRAVTVEPPSSGGRQEFRRHVRMTAQAMHLLRRWLPVLAAARRPYAVWTLVSHRVLRWLTAPLLATALVANGAHLAHPLYRVLFLGQLAFYALAVGGLAAERRGAPLGRLAVPYYFCVVALAAAAGVVQYLRGGVQATWTPGGRGAVAQPVREMPAA